MGNLLNPYMLFAAAGGGSAHQYWRINITTNNGDTYCGITEAEFRNEHLGPNLAVGGTAAASTVVGAYTAAKAFDSDLGDRSSVAVSWATNAVNTGWLSYAFTAPVLINEVMIWSRGDGGAAPNQAPRNFDIQSSDDNASWTTEWSVTGSVSWGPREGRVFTRPGYTRASYTGSPYGSHAYWRMFCTTYDGGAGPNVAASEIEFRNAAGADQASGGTASASSNAGGPYVAGNAFNNDAGASFWASTTEGGQAWIAYHFASAVEVKAVSWQARSDSDANQAVKDFAVQYSDNGTNWSTAWAGRGFTGWSLGQVKVFTDPDYI